MNKFLQKVARVFLGLSMAAGVGVAIGTGRKGASPVQASSVTIGYADLAGKGASGGASDTYDTDDLHLSFSKMWKKDADSYFRIYSKATLGISKKDGVSGTLSITNVVLTSNSSSNIKTWSASDSTSVTVSGSTATWSKAAGASSITLTNTASAQAQLTEISITYAISGGGDTPSLSSISVATAPTKLTYTAGDFFDPTGLVITRNYSSGSPDTYAYEGHTSDFSFLPSITTPLTTDDSSITISHGGKSTTQSITVSPASEEVIRTGTTTYVFTSKSWGATVGSATKNWTSGKDGNQLTANQGIQVSTGVSGANGTSPATFKNVSQIVVRYCTNDKAGVGTIKVQVGSGTEKTFSVTKPSSGGQTLKNATFTFSTYESGKVKITGLCTTNSVFIYSAAITCTPFTVTYNANGATSGTVPSDSTNYAVGETVTVKTNSGSLAKTGNTFSCWNTQANGQGTDRAEESSFTINGNVTLYAKWVPSTYTVSFEVDSNNAYGTLSSSSITNVPHGSEITTSGNTITINSTTITATPIADTDEFEYRFGSWANNTGTITGARTITASFTRTIRSYSVGGTIQYGHLSSTSSVQYGNTLSITIEADDSTLYTHPESITSVYMGNDLYNNYSYNSSTGVFSIQEVTGNVVINASCKPLVQPCTITYDEDGGTEVQDESIVPGGHPSFIASTKSGYNFKGWKTDGDNTLYTTANKNSYTVSTNVTFVAQWVAVFTVSYSTAVSSVDPTSEQIEVNGHPSFPTLEEPTHFTFNGWQVNGEGTVYTDSNDYTVTGNVSFVASWTEDSKVTVTYNANGGSVSPASESVYTGEKPSLPTPTKSGYSFDGWQVDGEGAYVTSEYTVGSTNVELVAHWTQIVEVTDTLTRATTGVDDGSSTYSDWSGKTSNSNAVYAGQSAGEHNSIQIRSKNSNSGIITTTSGGKLKSITVVFEGNTQAGRTINIYGKNSAYEAPTDLFDSEEQGTLLGTIVNGTSTSLSVSGDYEYVGLRSSDGAIYLSSVTIVWRGSAAPVSSYTVSYDANGGTGEALTDPNSPYTSGASVSVLNNTFTKEGYSFIGWNTEANGGGTSYEEGATFDISENTTLYAQWEEDSGGGSTTAIRSYRLVTSETELVTGAKYIITNASDTETGFFAIGAQKSSNRDAEPITADGSFGKVSSSAVDVITLGGSEGSWTLRVADGYLYAAASGSNSLKTREENSDENSEWTITINNGATSIVANGTNRSVMQYNYNGGVEKALFNCYSTASQSPVYIYRLDFETTLLANVTCTGSGSHTLPSGYSWNTDLLAVWNDLPSDEKSALASATAAPGSGLERYDYIIWKYNNEGDNTGKTAYNHFISGRSVRASQSALISLVIGEKANTIAIIVIISMVSVTAIGGYFFLRKRKEQ